MNPLKAKRRFLQLDNRKYGAALVEIPPHEWPDGAAALCQKPTRAWRSRHFCVQFWPETGPGCLGRLSAMRTEMDGRGGWRDGITWDELQRLKREAGFGDAWAVEVYPADASVVNVANFRHLWLLAEPPAFAWEKNRKHTTLTNEQRGEAAMKKRTLTPREEIVIEKLYASKGEHQDTLGYVTTTTELPMGSKDDNGPWGPNPDRIIPAGATLKIVMVSRMGDCGLTDNLKATFGYELRLSWDSAAMTDIRLTKEPTPCQP